MAENFLESIGLLPDRDADFELVSGVDVLAMDLSARPVNGPVSYTHLTLPTEA